MIFGRETSIQTKNTSVTDWLNLIIPKLPECFLKRPYFLYFIKVSNAFFPLDNIEPQPIVTYSLTPRGKIWSYPKLQYKRYGLGV